jgi:phosphate-selective porin OprO and OprP
LRLLKNIYWETLFSAIVLVAGNFQVFGQELADDSLTNDASSHAVVKYGSKGFEFNTRDNRFLLQIQSRLQFRFATPEDQDPVTFDEFTDEKNTQFKINRARIKIGGHAFQPWIKYDWEFELAQTNLLNFRMKLEKWEWLSLQVGQWKIEYSRERVISSGEQQMVDRSVINRPFTIDRQQGVGVYGHLNGNGAVRPAGRLLPPSII